MHAIVVTHLFGCVKIVYSSYFLFLERRRLNPGLVHRLETPGFPSKMRLPSNTNAIPIPVPTKLPAFQGYSRQCRYTIGSPLKRAVYAEIWEKLWKSRFQELEHESKMRLLKTHSHTFGRRGYDADKEGRVKGKETEEKHR